MVVRTSIVTVVVTTKEKSRVLSVSSPPPLTTGIVVVVVVDERGAKHSGSNSQTEAESATVQGLVTREQAGVGLGVGGLQLHHLTLQC